MKHRHGRFEACKIFEFYNCHLSCMHCHIGDLQLGLGVKGFCNIIFIIKVQCMKIFFFLKQDESSLVEEEALRS